MDNRADPYQSQIKIYIETDGSIYKEIAAPPIESLVFEGGGVRGVGYIGATRALFEAGIMPGVLRVTGSSAGAMTACAVALGYPQERVASLHNDSNYVELLETKNLFTPAKLAKFLKNGYFHKGNGLLTECRKRGKERFTDLMNQYRLTHANEPEKLREMYDYHFNPERMTFQDLHDLSRLMPEAGMKDIYLIATKLPEQRGGRCEVKIFSAEHTPHVEVSMAALASCAVPGLMKPVEIDGSRYLDGGCISNFPIETFNGHAYKPRGATIFQGSGGQNYSTLGIKIDTADEINALLYAPIKDEPLRKKYMQKLIDTISGLPLYQSDNKMQRMVRDQFGHRTCQLSDEGIHWLDFTLAAEEKQKLVQRDYEDMTNWINNYYQAAIESRKFSSFAAMCYNMSIEELKIFCDELQQHPQAMIHYADECARPVPLAVVKKFQESANKILTKKLAAFDIIDANLPHLNADLRKYKIELKEIYESMESHYEVSDIQRWIKSAEEAVKIILSSSKNNFVKRDDVMKLTKFINDLKLCTQVKKPYRPGLFDEFKEQKFYAPQCGESAFRR